MKIVLDASVALSWLMRRVDADEAEMSRSAAQGVMGEGALVPSIFFTEVTNGLVVAERAGSLAADLAKRFLADLDALPIETDRGAPDALQRAVFGLARATGLTAYDATYLELALRSGSPLATFDRQLAAAAPAAGVTLFSRTGPL